MNRYDARENAFAVIFSSNFQKEVPAEQLIELYLESKEIEGDEYFKKLVNTTHSHLNEIDELISGSLKNWTLQRISKVTLAALRLGVCEIKFLGEDTPSNVAINENVELAKKYEGQKCAQFVNGILSSVVAK